MSCLIGANGRWETGTRDRDDYWKEDDVCPMCSGKVVLRRISLEEALAGCSECSWCQTGMKFCLGGTKFGIKRY